MSDWYVSSAAYAAVTAWAATTAKTVGLYVRATAPASGKEYVWRCTTAGTTGGTEPTWSTAYTNNSTRTDGTVTWTNVTGQSTYGWSAAAGTLWSIANANSNRPVAGDRVFISSDHSESFAAATTYAFNASTQGFGVIQILSVNRAGSVPPVAADLQTGAALAISTGSTLTLDCQCPMYWEGVGFSITGGTGSMTLSGSSGSKGHYLKNCTFSLGASSSTRMTIGTAPARIIFDNTSITFGHASQAIVSSSVIFDFVWLNTSSPLLGGTLPTSLFTTAAGFTTLFTARGVDLSALTGNLYTPGTSSGGKFLLDSCKIASGLTRYNTASSGNASTSVEEVELVNCWDGSSVINERHTPAGTVTTDRSTYLTSGAQDDIGAYSIKLVSNARSDFATFTFDAFWCDVENTSTGASKTATVEIISSGSLNNNDIRLMLEYMGTSGNPIASFGDSLATVLTAAAALSSSSNTWTGSPGTPQKQLLQITFTPQRAGRVRGLVRLGKVSTTVWVNPQITIS